MSDLSEFLLTTGRTLAQMTLYSPDHPSVKGAVEESHRLLGVLLAQDSELVVANNESKLIVNGKKPTDAPDVSLRPFLQLLTVHNLHSLTFLRGIPLSEMIPFFRLASASDMRRTNLKAAEFLDSQQVTHIKLNEARYAKIGEDDAVTKKEDMGALGGLGAEGGLKDFETLPLQDLLKKLIEKSVLDPADRGRLLSRALDLVKDQIDRAVEKVVVEFNQEKTRLTNEQIRTESVIGETAEGVVVVDETGKVLLMNSAAESIYGVKLGESVGRPLWEGIREEQMVALAKDLTVPTDRPLTREVQVLGSQEAKKTLRASSATVQDTNGRIIGMVSVLSDVTKQKELTRLQNEFMANVTHDLRAPVHALKLSVNAILEESAGPVTQDQKKMLSMAVRNVDRLSRLIDDLLDFSKMESGKMDIRPQVVELEPLLKEATVSMETWSKGRGIHVEYQQIEEIPPAFVDSDRILQVVNNLISNAIKFTPSGGKVMVRAKRYEESGKNMIVVEVEDTGPGISKEDQKRIFDRFVQLKPNEKLDIRGTGLGLSICQALVDLHKGKLWVHSPPPTSGTGSLFSFTVPCVQRSANSVVVPQPLPASAPSPAQPHQSRPGFWKKIFRGFSAFIFVSLAVLSPLLARPYWGTVRRVLDSNLIQLEDGTRVRYLGVIVPKKGSLHAIEAMSANRAWVEKKEVQFKYGLQERDIDGVWLAYVFVDGIFVNQELVKQGLALVSTLPNEESYLPDLIAAEKEAHDNRRGQWRDSALDLYPIRVRKKP
ncbi:MAG: Adaptive-response sensory-kinase SasA [Elusimicrobia bacterium]|nr:Adaptive-response sensory-kinase SasA [Elusimicrobiota bacterium]